MKTKRFLSLFIAVVLCLSSFAAFAADETANDQLKVFYNDEIITFDVEPVIEDGRTLVPLRAIFETMGCAVSFAELDEKQMVYAHRTDDSLSITIGENKMYFNDREITLDVPAKIKNGRTLVPLRAISEAFECEVHWDGDTRTIYIYSPASAYVNSVERIAETITDDEGNVLIEAVAYYPVFENPTEMPCLDAINTDYKWDADKFIEEARGKKEDALALKEQMGEKFTPFVYELTYEQTYSIWGFLSFVNHKYINIGGAHPTKIMESKTYCTSYDNEMSVSDMIEEEMLDVSLTDYITNLFVDKLKEIAPESADTYTYDYVKEYLGYVQFYLTKNSLVLYFNQGEITPYVLGVISVEIPNEPGLLFADTRRNYEEEIVFEQEYYDGYEWKVISYTEDKLVVTEENTDYPPEETYSEYYPVGLHIATVKGVKKGNATMILAHIKKGEDIKTATQIYRSVFYVDEDNMLTLITEEEAMDLISEYLIYPLTETLDLNTLENSTVSVSLEKGGVYVDGSGNTVMDAKIYTYELYDMVDIASLEVGDRIFRRCEEIVVTEVERLASGLVRINGGEENGGFDLISDDGTVYYEVGMNNVKAYYELFEETLPVSDKFEYVDESEPDSKAKHYSVKDFLAKDSGIEYNFYPSNTSIVIENGKIVKMNKIYIP